MPHISLPEGLPGILGPLVLRPETGEPMSALTEALLRGPSPLSRGERELIAAYVSEGNDCEFCAGSHEAFAACQLDGGRELTGSVLRDLPSADVSPKLRALLAIADQVRVSGRAVTGEAIEAARAEGASDIELHDTVLIAAAFCMFNRYVDGLATLPMPDTAAYDGMAQIIVEQGYSGTLAQFSGGAPA